MSDLPITGGIMLPLVFLQNFVSSLFNGTAELENMIPILIIAALIYVAALILSKATSCIVIYGWRDLLLVAAPMIIIICVFLFNVLLGNDRGTPIAADNLLANILVILSMGASFAVSIVVNLRYNALPQSVFFAVISIIAKPIIMVVMVAFAILSLALLDSAYTQSHGKKDRRFKSGYRPKNRWIMGFVLIIIGFLARFLIGGIIKKPQEIREQAAYQEHEDYNENEDEDN